MKSYDNVFFSPQLILQKTNGYFHRKLSFSEVPEGIQHFPRGGGVQLFVARGSNCLFPIETNITFDFPEVEGPDPCPPLDPPMVEIKKPVEFRSNSNVSQRLIPGIGYHSAEWFGFCTHIWPTNGAYRIGEQRTFGRICAYA